MSKKIMFLLLSVFIILNSTACGTAKLEEKCEAANYQSMQTGKFNAKYTFLDECTVKKFFKDDKDDENSGINVEDKEKNSYNLIILNSGGKQIKSKTGTIIKIEEKIKVLNAEVVPETLKKNATPTLYVNESDIELIGENVLQGIFENNKNYSDLTLDELSYIDLMKNGDLKYDEKYSDIAEGLKEQRKQAIEEKVAQTNAKIKESENTPQDVKYKYKAKFGELLEANKLGNKLTVKFKIEPKGSNKTTIHQNGYNVEDLILNQGCDSLDSIDYWAIASMEDGSESKVISFTLDKNLIDKVKNKQIVGNQIVDKANDVWILPSLK